MLVDRQHETASLGFGVLISKSDPKVVESHDAMAAVDEIHDTRYPLGHRGRRFQRQALHNANQDSDDEKHKIVADNSHRRIILDAGREQGTVG
jgi:hypothetical protein